MGSIKSEEVIRLKNYFAFPTVTISKATAFNLPQHSKQSTHRNIIRLIKIIHINSNHNSNNFSVQQNIAFRNNIVKIYVKIDDRYKVEQSITKKTMLKGQFAVCR